MQRLKLDINPKGEIPVLYVSQYDKGRLFEVELVEGDQAYNLPLEYSVQLNVRKTDSKLVTAAPDSIVDNILTFSTSEQMTACAGENIGSVTLKDADDFVITTLYFLISVQRDVLAGGIDSQSEIHNLEEQIASIVPEVIGADYYNKTETDALLADKANVSDLDALASKAELENAIEEEDRTLKDWAFTQFVTQGYIASRYYNKTEVDNLLDNIFPTLSASGAIASFKTALNKPLVSVAHDTGATAITRCGKNLCATNLFTDGSVGGISYSKDDNGKITISANSAISVAQRIDIGSMTLPAGTYKLTGIGNIEYLDLRLRTVIDLGSTEFAVCNKNNQSVSFTLTETTTFYAVFIVLPNFVGTTVCEQMIRVASDMSSNYETYIGQTVIVADATTLTTLSGVNNVFADSGIVTVQYKYMSM